MNKFNRNSFRGKDNRGDRQMHKATCAECGNSCEVPFKPTNSKPVFCSNCFKKDSSGPSKGGGGGRNFRDRDDGRGRLTMHKTTCSECGSRCEVPFKPTSSKPVYCSDCFRGISDRPSPGSSQPDLSNEKFQEINEKLNKILFLLQRKNAIKEITVMKPKKEKDASKKVAEKVVAKKAPVKKKSVKKAVKKVTKKAPVKKKAAKKTVKKAVKKKSPAKKAK